MKISVLFVLVLLTFTLARGPKPAGQKQEMPAEAPAAPEEQPEEATEAAKPAKPEIVFVPGTYTVTVAIDSEVYF